MISRKPLAVSCGWKSQLFYWAPYKDHVRISPGNEGWCTALDAPRWVDSEAIIRVSWNPEPLMLPAGVELLSIPFPLLWLSILQSCGDLVLTTRGSLVVGPPNRGQIPNRAKSSGIGNFLRSSAVLSAHFYPRDVFQGTERTLVHTGWYVNIWCLVHPITWPKWCPVDDRWRWVTLAIFLEMYSN